jgi:hypothetical protein
MTIETAPASLSGLREKIMASAVAADKTLSREETEIAFLSFPGLSPTQAGLAVPGEITVLLDCLETSPLPVWLADKDGLRTIENGEKVCYGPFKLKELAPDQRIVVDAIKVRFTRNADGSLGQLTPGSTQAVTMTIAHPGICRTRRFSFEMP